MDRLYHVLDPEHYDMRKKLKFVLALLFVAILGVLGYLFYDTFQKKEIQFEKIQNIPEFSLHDTKGNLRIQKDILKGEWTVFIFFNSECHYCQEEAEQLGNVKGKINGTNFLWISTESMEVISDFQERYLLADNMNIVFLQDAEALFSTDLSIESTPQFLVYSPKGKLIKNHKGPWRIDKLLENIANGFETP